MKTYFCPNCGIGLESKDLIKKNGIVICMGKQECFECHHLIIPVLSGASLILSGLFVGLLMGMVLDELISSLGIIIGCTFLGLGGIRLITQFYKKRVHFRVCPLKNDNIKYKIC